MKIYKKNTQQESPPSQLLIWKFDPNILITHFVLSPLGNLTAIVVDNKELQIYDFNSSNMILKKVFPKFLIQEVKFCPKGKWIAVIQLGSKRISMFHLYKQKKLEIKTLSFFLLEDNIFFTKDRKELFALMDGNLYHKKINAEGQIPLSVFIEQIQLIPENILVIGSQSTLNFYWTRNHYKKFQQIYLNNKVSLIKCQKQLLCISTAKDSKVFQLRNTQCKKMIRKFKQPYTIYDMHPNNRQLIINYGINITLLYFDTFLTTVLNTKDPFFEKVYLSKSNQLYILDSKNQIKQIEIKN